MTVLSLAAWLNGLGQDFYRNFIFEDRYMWLLRGLWNTLLMTLFAGLIGILIGLVLSLIRVLHKSGAKIGILNAFANLYITVLRGTPVVIQILIINIVIFESVSES